MDIILVPLLLLIRGLFSLAIFIVVADALVSLLFACNILNVNNQILYSIMSTLRRISDVMCDPVRNRFPVLVGTLDFSPIVVILSLSALEMVIDRILMKIG